MSRYKQSEKLAFDVEGPSFKECREGALASVQRLLLCNGAHLGDLILSTAVLPVLKAACPHIQVGFLVGSWSLPVVQHHLNVDWIHVFDNPRLNRSSLSEKEKKKRGNYTWHQAIQEVKEKRYDLAMDLYYFYRANAGTLLAKAAIPSRWGFWASPSHFSYTHRVFWDHSSLHMVENHGMMLRKLGIREEFMSLLKPTLHYNNRCEPYILPKECEKRGYLVLHMGAGDRRREWNVSAWKHLVQHLSCLGFPIVFLGHGKKEQELADQMAALVSCPVNLCNQLEWRQLFPIIEHARLFIGLESMGGHLAAALNTPAVVIYGNQKNIPCWRPYHPACQVVAPVSFERFNPRLKKFRFAAIHTIHPDEVLAKIQVALGPLE